MCAIAQVIQAFKTLATHPPTHRLANPESPFDEPSHSPIPLHTLLNTPRTPYPLLLYPSRSTQAARRGVLIRGAVVVECLSRVNVVAVDKTGTLTTGRFEVLGMIFMTSSNTLLNTLCNISSNVL